MQRTNPDPTTSDPQTMAALGAMTATALAADRAHTDTLVPLAEDESHATPCPPWCVIDHTDWHEDGDYHFGEGYTAGPVWMTLDINSADTVSIEINLPGGASEKLDLDEVDALIARLTELRPVLADTITQRRADS